MSIYRFNFRIEFLGCRDIEAILLPILFYRKMSTSRRSLCRFHCVENRNYSDKKIILILLSIYPFIRLARVWRLNSLCSEDWWWRLEIAMDWQEESAVIGLAELLLLLYLIRISCILSIMSRRIFKCCFNLLVRFSIWLIIVRDVFVELQWKGYSVSPISKPDRSPSARRTRDSAPASPNTMTVSLTEMIQFKLLNATLNLNPKINRNEKV